MQRTDRRAAGSGGMTPTQPSRNGHSPDGQAPRARQRAFCVAALAKGEDDLAELGELLRTAGVGVVGEMVQQREQPHPNTYLGPGKVAEAKVAAKAADANLIACDDELTARQERNLEEAVGLPVVDRTTVILDIFA
jgi:GTPase